MVINIKIKSKLSRFESQNKLVILDRIHFNTLEMLLSKKIIKAVEFHTEIIKLFYPEKGMENKDAFTRTHFNNMAIVINKTITRSVIAKPELVAHYFAANVASIASRGSPSSSPPLPPCVASNGTNANVGGWLHPTASATTNRAAMRFIAVRFIAVPRAPRSGSGR